MQAHATDPGVFIRSMATRGHLGGLAAATDHVVTILSAAGKDVVLVETVGVGQDEVEIVGTADVSVVVLVPGLGDEVQALKAGIMEIADVFVVNKADREGVDRVVAEIESMLSLVPSDTEPPAIVRTVATRDEGTRALVDAVVAFHARARETGALERKRRMTLGRQLEDAVTRRLVERAIGGARPRGEGGARREAGAARARSLERGRGARGKGGARVKILRIDHLGIAVKSLADAVQSYEALGFQVGETHDVPTEKVRAAFLAVGESQLELLEPTEPELGDRALPREALGAAPRLRAGGRHRRGARGAKARGVPLVDETPRVGRGRLPRGLRAPEGRAGVLLELKRSDAAVRDERDPSRRGLPRRAPDRVVSPVGPGSQGDRRSDG